MDLCCIVKAAVDYSVVGFFVCVCVVVGLWTCAIVGMPRDLISILDATIDYSVFQIILKICSIFRMSRDLAFVPITPQTITSKPETLHPEP